MRVERRYYFQFCWDFNLFWKRIIVARHQFTFARGINDIISPSHSSVAKPPSTINFWQLIHLILFFQQPLAISRHSPQNLFTFSFTSSSTSSSSSSSLCCFQSSPVSIYLFFLFSFCIPFYFRRWLYAQSYLPSFSVAFILHDVIKPFCW